MESIGDGGRERRKHPHEEIKEQEQYGERQNLPKKRTCNEVSKYSQDNRYRAKEDEGNTMKQERFNQRRKEEKRVSRIKENERRKKMRRKARN